MSVKTRLSGLTIIAAAVCGLGTLQRCWSQDTNYLEGLKRLYAFDSWAGQTKIHYDRLVTNWVPDFASLGVTNITYRYEGVWTNSRKDSRYMFHLAETNSVDLRIAEREDVTNADLAMLEFFTWSQALQPFPLGSSFGVDIGDRCYVGWGGPSAVFFVRNNVFVSVTSIGGSDSTLFAEKLDSELVAGSFMGPVLLQPEIINGVFHVSVATAPGKIYTLQEAKDLVTGTNWTTGLSFTGDGTIMLVMRPVGGAPQWFFRLWIQ